MFKMYEEPELPNEGACVRYFMNRRRQMRRRVVDILRNRIRQIQMREHVKIYDEPDSPSKGGACLRYVMNRNRQMSGRVWGAGGGGCATPQPPLRFLKPYKVA